MTPPSLQTAIDAFNANDLGAILYHAGVADLPKTKEGKVKLWAQKIGDEGALRGALARLSPRPRPRSSCCSGSRGKYARNASASCFARDGILETKRDDTAGPRALIDVKPASTRTRPPLNRSWPICCETV